MPSNHLILCRPLLLLPPVPPSIRVFSNELALRKRWPKYWSFSFSISPSNEHPGLISSRMDWLDLLAVHGTLKSLLQHHSSKASIQFSLEPAKLCRPLGGEAHRLLWLPSPEPRGDLEMLFGPSWVRQADGLLEEALAAPEQCKSVLSHADGAP